MKSLLGVLISVGLMVALGAAPALASNGQAYFNYDVNWWNTPNLYFTVAGGPPNTCGDLWADRNGSGNVWNAGGWLCTDSYGNATKGPWTYANQNGTETAYVFIQWPDGSKTNTAKHVWDKTAPTVTINSPVASPPTYFYGTAADGWGAGFNANWASCMMSFRDEVTHKYWAAGSYSESSRVAYSCQMFGMPSTLVSWGQPQSSLPSVHNAGHCYTWTVEIFDGGNITSASRYFCL